MKFLSAEQVTERVGALPPIQKLEGHLDFDRIGVGEGMLVPYHTKSRARDQTRLSVKCRYWGKKLGRKFVTRKTDDGVLVIRVS